MKKYNITFQQTNGDEQVTTAYANDQRTALQNAIGSVNLDDLEYLTLKNGMFFDKWGEIYETLPSRFVKNSELLYIGGGLPVVVSYSDIYIDEIPLKTEIVEIKRGDLVEYSVPTKGMDYVGGGVAWLRFQNQFGKGWVLLDQNNPSKNYSVYDANIYAVNRSAVTYQEGLNELVRTVWWDDEEETA